MIYFQDFIYFLFINYDFAITFWHHLKDILWWWCEFLHFFLLIMEKTSMCHVLLVQLVHQFFGSVTHASRTKLYIFCQFQKTSAFLNYDQKCQFSCSWHVWGNWSKTLSKQGTGKPGVATTVEACLYSSHEIRCVVKHENKVM